MKCVNVYMLKTLQGQIGKGVVFEGLTVIYIYHRFSAIKISRARFRVLLSEEPMLRASMADSHFFPDVHVIMGYSAVKGSALTLNARA